MNELVYLIKLKIREEKFLPNMPANYPVKVGARYIDLYFKEIPTYRRIKMALEEEHCINVDNFNIDGSPEFYKDNTIGNISIAMATSPLWS